MAFAGHLEGPLKGRLLFAVPKKGRLNQATLDLLSGSDIQFRREPRSDIALVKNHNIALIFLPAADIPTFVGEGRVDLGITGSDQVAEHEVHDKPTESTGVEQVLDLGFGRCKLQVQTPEGGKLADPKDLIGKSVCTSFMGLTEKYFSDMEKQDGQTNGDISANPAMKPRTRVTRLNGSVEAACTLGVADGVVDLVESGETMRAMRLRAIDTVFSSTAVLIKSKHPSNQELVDLIASRIKGIITAQKYVLCQYNIPRKLREIAFKITPGKRAPTVTSLEDPDWVAISVMVLKEKVAGDMDELERVGATDILVLDIVNTRTGA